MSGIRANQKAFKENNTFINSSVYKYYLMGINLVQKTREKFSAISGYFNKLFGKESQFRKDLISLFSFFLIYGIPLNFIAFVLLGSKLEWYTPLGYGFLWYFVAEEIPRVLPKLFPFMYNPNFRRGLQ